MAALKGGLADLQVNDRQELEAWLVEFDQQWSIGALREWARRLPPTSPWRLPALCEMVKIDLEHQWTHGNQPSLEAYLQDYPELGHPNVVSADLIVVEYEVRQQFGAVVDLDDYAHRFPSQIDDLRRLVAEGKTASFPGIPAGRAPLHSPQPHVSATDSIPPSLKSFGRYRLIKRLGSGTMGTVYLALDEGMGREVALKVCDVGGYVGGMERFQREARVLATLSHPSICPVYHNGVENGVPFFTMEYIKGKTMESALPPKGMGIKPRQAVLIVRKIAQAMQAAHAQGVIHRDLKPSNIMMKQNEPVIVDFGSAHFDSPAESALTEPGFPVGTPIYMPLEQLHGDAIGPRSDIYALGVIMYELLTGNLPFGGTRSSIVAQKETHSFQPPRMLKPDLDPRLEEICLKAMAKLAGDRYESMGDLAADLTESLKSQDNLPIEAIHPARPSAQPKPPGTRPILKSWLSSTVTPHGPRIALGASFGGMMLLGIIISVTIDLGEQKKEIKIVVKQDGKKIADITARPKTPEPGTLANEGKTAGEVRDDNFLKMKFCWCPKSTFPFLMGSPPDEPNRHPDEGPVKVTMSQGFWMGKFEVTQDEWRQVMGTSLAEQQEHKGAYGKVTGQGPKQPMYFVNHSDVEEFCARFTESERRAGRLPLEWSYRLPTEAQWEYACRAGTTSATAFGIRLSSRQANFDGREPYNGADVGPNEAKTTTVGLYGLGNAWGLLDMHGNVWEWCRDGYAEQLPGGVDPVGPSEASNRVIRGGCWTYGGGLCRSASRGTAASGNRDFNLGFRVARVPSVPLLPAAPKTAAAVPLKEWTSPFTGMKLALVPAGSFDMGSPDDDKEARDDEKPRHRGMVSRPFYLGVYEVTQGEYHQVMGKKPSYFKGSDSLPVEMVTWFDAVKFCNALSPKEGLTPFYKIDADDRVTVPDWNGTGYRLPTEAEWEYACRAGSTTRYSFGDEPTALGEYAWYGTDEDVGGKTHSVGRKRANSFGLYDMYGNVFEWCGDWYAEDYKNTAPNIDARGPETGTTRVLRGGGWNDVATTLRSAYRLGYAPADRNCISGFRLAKTCH